MQVVCTSFVLYLHFHHTQAVKRLLSSFMERETRFELATTCLEGRYSTTELLPLTFKYYVKKGAKASCALMNLDTVLLRS